MNYVTLPLPTLTAMRDKLVERITTAGGIDTTSANGSMVKFTGLQAMADQLGEIEAAIALKTNQAARVTYVEQNRIH